MLLSTAPGSGAEFPVLFAGELAKDQPYFLVDEPADWMHGSVRQWLVGRPSAQSPGDFRSAYAGIVGSVQSSGRLEGGVACAGDDYFVFWGLGDAAPDATQQLAASAGDGWSHEFVPQSTTLEAGLWDQWPGMTITVGRQLQHAVQAAMGDLSPAATPRPIAPDTVRVWRGYRGPDKSYADFASFLGSIFVPACALLQPRAGLVAYLPSMMSQDGKPATVPDQTALMFWATEQAHDAANGTVAVRAYQNLHGGAYDTSTSSSATPAAFDGAVVAEQPYHLLNGEADWMLGVVRHFVGGRPDAQDPGAWLAELGTWASDYAEKPPAGVDGALLCAGVGYVAFWEHAADGAATAGLELDQLASLATPYLSKTAESVAPGAGLWDQWSGWDLTQHDCMNVQLDRAPHEGGAPARDALGRALEVVGDPGRRRADRRQVAGRWHRHVASAPRRRRPAPRLARERRATTATRPGDR